MKEKLIILYNYCKHNAILVWKFLVNSNQAWDTSEMNEKQQRDYFVFCVGICLVATLLRTLITDFSIQSIIVRLAIKFCVVVGTWWISRALVRPFAQWLLKVSPSSTDATLLATYGLTPIYCAEFVLAIFPGLNFIYFVAFYVLFTIARGVKTLFVSDENPQTNFAVVFSLVVWLLPIAIGIVMNKFIFTNMPS